MFRHALLFPLTAVLLIFTACKQEKKESTSTSDSAAKTEILAVPKFDRDSAYHYVEQQVSYGPRVTGSAAHKQCKAWLVSKFQEFGADVLQQDFTAKVYTGQSLPATNIIARFNPDSPKRIVLAAHWDSRHLADSPINTIRQNEPVLGADDGGSGVAVLLEIARQLGQSPVKMGVDLVLFDAEDYGESGGEDINTWALGAQYWSRNLPYSGAQKPKYGILLDMVGAKGARFAKEYYSMQYAPELTNKTWKLAEDLGYSNYFVNESAGGVTDDHYFVNTIAGIPMIDIINRPVDSSTGFGTYWHTHDDNMDVIDYRTLRAVGQLLLNVVYKEDAGSF
ncbi:MAG TPA: M28 family peptidase [Saprospiraceae bacterium]|nr:M28 family peptidase [Saprospiraceae bacterium]HMQ85771.1 M28 family peptidase [Saprospiraceae bacterium]